MTTTIRGFILPDLLEQFLNDGIWTHNRSITIPPEMLSSVRTYVDDVRVRLYDLEGLKHDNGYFDRLSDEDFEFLKILNAWESSKRSGMPIADITKLDIDYAVCIASELDDEVVHLDYRSDRDNPRVVMMDWDKREWRIVSPDFQIFAKGVGLLD